MFLLVFLCPGKWSICTLLFFLIILWKFFFLFDLTKTYECFVRITTTSYNSNNTLYNANLNIYFCLMFTMEHFCVVLCKGNKCSPCTFFVIRTTTKNIWCMLNKYINIHTYLHSYLYVCNVNEIDCMCQLYTERKVCRKYFICSWFLQEFCCKFWRSWNSSKTNSVNVRADVCPPPHFLGDVSQKLEKYIPYLH